MSRRGARLAVAVLFAAVLGAATWQFLHDERAIRSQTSAAAAFERDARATLAAVAELRSAQQAYVAAGQGADYWTTRAFSLAQSLEPRIGALRQVASAPEGIMRLEAASTTFNDFVRMDGRAREHALAGQRLLASDLIYTDGLEMTQAMATAIEGARQAEALARTAAAARAAMQQRALLAGVAGLGLLFMFILAFAGGRTARAVKLEQEPEPEAPQAPADSILDLKFDEPEPPAVDLKAAADLCLDLARVNDTREIPALLDRAARILDASGIVLWIAEPDGGELVPTVAHGYPPAAVIRLTAIPRDADNVTAAAFRDGRVQSVKGDGLTSGAIAAPLVAPTGCVGVMAAEIRHEREQRAEVRAVAAILAAQLGTLVGAPAAAAAPKAHAN
ncbi:MAG TPA: GAF domain-containing protein [Vicinamibacterales bacterium]|nr:GAF domain-containing protein [Vicinamibacterales bacterium]